MHYVVLLILALLTLILLGKFSQAKPGNVAVFVRNSIGGLCILIAGLLTLRGALPLALPLFLFGLATLIGGTPFGSNFPWARKSPGQKSRVATKILTMELDHDSGEMDGEILEGEFAGRRLRELSLDQLRLLRKTCLSAGDQSAALLDAYLDRVHAKWRGEDERSQKAADGTGAMSVREACEILGVAANASADDVRAAHRKMMKQFHPDAGGSDYLAVRINQAKDILLATAG